LSFRSEAEESAFVLEPPQIRVAHPFGLIERVGYSAPSAYFTITTFTACHSERSEEPPYFARSATNPPVAGYPPEPVLSSSKDLASETWVSKATHPPDTPKKLSTPSAHNKKYFSSTSHPIPMTYTFSTAPK
jgi:hypothetical protein